MRGALCVARANGGHFGNGEATMRLLEEQVKIRTFAGKHSRGKKVVGHL